MSNQNNVNNLFKMNVSKLHFMGYCIGINSEYAKVRIPTYSNLDKFIDKNIPYNHTSLNAYVIMQSSNCYFVGVITAEDMLETDVKDFLNNDNGVKNSANYMTDDNSETPELYVKILAEINPVDLSIKSSVQHSPKIGSKVYLANEDIVKKYIKDVSDTSKKFKTKKFAKLLQGKNIPVNLSFQSLFGNHLGIIGSTGSGKSYTAAKLIMELIDQNQHVILLDPTGEYKPIVKYIENRNSDKVCKFDIGNGTRIPFCDLNENEMYKLIRPSFGIQLPELRKAIKCLKLEHIRDIVSSSNQIKYLEKYCSNNNFIKMLKAVYKHRDSLSSLRSYIIKYIEKYNVDENNIGYDFTELPNEIKEVCKVSNTNGYYLRNCESLIDRIDAFISNPLLMQNFCNYPERDNKTDNTFHGSLNYSMAIKKSLIYIDLENVTLANSVSEVVGDYIARKLLTSFTQYQSKNDSINPIVLFLDEAHNFIKPDNLNDALNLHYFDLIAKEGRKYGLFMTLITQSPFDLSRNVLTQFGTFIIHHLGNGKERNQITGALPYNSHLDQYISSLNTGDAIISSNNLSIPLMVHINKPKVPPKSHTPEFK